MSKILCVGPQWRGSNAAALFKAFSRLGHVIHIVDENYYINLSNRLLLTKVIDKILFNKHCLEFNKAIEEAVTLFKPDLIVIYKGAFLFPEYLERIKTHCSVVNVYPDVSFKTHGKLLPQTLPLYDWVFTTKTFGIEDMKKELGVVKSSFVPHGFDPDIHRPMILEKKLSEDLSSDVSFIGTYSPKKEKYLSALIQALPHITLKIWGNGWGRSSASNIKKNIQYRAVVGDLYSLTINASKVNLGILSERVQGASSGDLITSRTFHIPASGGFMLHERTRESVLYYKEGIECDFFEGEEELIEKVNQYLLLSEERGAIALAGMKRAQENYAIDKRAEMMLSILEKENVLK